jgi:hypothetical protein
MEATDVLPIVSLLMIPTVEYGGWALLGFVTGRGSLGGPDTIDHRTRFFRAGHAHAGVLLVLSLAYFLYLPRADFSNGLDWILGLVLLAGILAQAGGFFIHMAEGAPDRASRGTTLTRVGAILIAVALVALAVGLMKEL